MGEFVVDKVVNVVGVEKVGRVVVQGALQGPFVKEVRVEVDILCRGIAQSRIRSVFRDPLPGRTANVALDAGDG